MFCAPNLPRFPSIFLTTMPFNLTFRCCFTESIILKAKGITSLFSEISPGDYRKITVSFSSIGSRGYCVRQFFLESIDVRNIGLVPAVVGEFYDVQIRRMSDHKIDLLSVPFAQLCCDRLGKRLSIGDIDTLDCVVDRRPFAHNAIDIIDNFFGGANPM